MSDPNDPNLPLKNEICDIGRRMWQKSFCAGNEGNISARIGDDRVLSSPTGVSKGFLTPEMITLVDMAGTQIDTENPAKRTSEIFLHLQIYKKRPDVRAVIHSHPPHATAFACSGIPIPECIHPEAEFFLGKIPTVAYVTPGYQELGQSVCDIMLPETNTVLLGNHGAVNFAATLMDAYYKLEILDAYCRLLMNLRQLGQVHLLSGAQMLELLRLKEKWGVPDSRSAAERRGRIGSDNGPYLAGFPRAARPAAKPPA